MKNLLILATMLLTFRFSNAQSSSPFDGVWTGQGYQPNSSWSIKLTIKNNSAYIEYPSLQCSGNCTIIKQSENELLLEEKIANGTGRCADGGTIQLKKISDDIFSFNWSFSNGDLGASGTLRRFY